MFGLVCFSKMFIDPRRRTNKRRGKIQKRVEDIKGQGSGESRRQHRESRWRVGFEQGNKIPRTSLCGRGKGKEEGRSGAKSADGKNEFEDFISNYLDFIAVRGIVVYKEK